MAIYDFEDYRKAKQEKWDANLTGIIERFLEAKVLADLPGFMQEFGRMRERLRLIEEANHKHFPLPSWNMPPEPPMIEDIRIPKSEYERLMRLTNTILTTATDN